jgi:O-6-methylguanine DNA methyltransferase
MKPTLVQYDAPGWGVGEIWLDEEGRVFHSELPRPKRTRPTSEVGHVRGRQSRARPATGKRPGRLDGTWQVETCPTSEVGHVLGRRLAAFFSGAPDDFADVALRLDEGFYGDCARALRALPRGEVVTYGELAALAGRPGAARAAGTFCARCELAPFLPVHRVVAANGIGSWGTLGTDYKRRLLELEGVTL